MIGTMTEHDGDGVLGSHLGKLDDNETISFRTVGLSACTIVDAISEMMLMATGCRTTKPLIHAMASPSISYNEADWALYWDAFETEFGLHGHPYLEVRHLKYGKGGRTAEHAHRVYLRIDIDGRAIRTSHSAIRQEKISRIAEHLAGERFTSGCFNRAVIARLRREGRAEIADAMVRAGLADRQAVAAPTSSERAMTERLGDLAADEVWRRAASAWRRSDTGAALKAALAEAGLRLAMGDKVPVVVSPGGAAHPLLRAVNKGGERQRGQSVRKAELEARLKDLDLPAAGDLRPVPGFDAGAFAITNLDRLPLTGVTTPATTADMGHDMSVSPDPAPQLTREQDAASLKLENTEPVPARTEPVRLLSAEQEMALRELENAFHSTAADRAKAARQAIEAEVVAGVEQRRLNQALRQRMEAEFSSWDLPGIGVTGWRDNYRAELAGLPKKYGPHLRWVDRLDAEKRRVVLRSGATVNLAPTRTWTQEPGGRDAMAIMIAHARKRGWSSVTISGSANWRTEMTKAATRAGLKVTDADLVAIAQAEKARIAHEHLLEDWWRARDTFLNAPSGQRRTERAAVIALLERIERHPGILDIIADETRRRILEADLEALERYRVARLERLPDERPPGPG